MKRMFSDEVGSRDKCPVFSNLDVSSRLAEVTDKRSKKYVPVSQHYPSILNWVKNSNV